MKLVRVAVALAALALSAPVSMAQQSGVNITQVTFKAGAPISVVGLKNLSSGAVSAGCTTAASRGAADFTCATSLVPTGGTSGSTGVFVLNSSVTSITATATAPGGNCQTQTVNVRANGNVIYSGCLASGKFTLTVAKDGSISVSQQ